MKTILVFFVHQGRISKDIFPYSPFVNVNRSSKGTDAYSKSEFSAIMRHLWGQVEFIRKGKYTGSHRQALAVLALVIAAKTGRNTSTILTLGLDCIQPHPLSPDTHILFTGFKRRGMNTSVQAMRSSVSIEDVFSANKNIEDIVHLVKEVTNELRKKTTLDSLFLTTDKNSEVVSFIDQYFWASVKGIYKKANLTDDQGNTLLIQVKRLRKNVC